MITLKLHSAQHFSQMMEEFCFFLNIPILLQLHYYLYSFAGIFKHYLFSSYLPLTKFNQGIDVFVCLTLNFFSNYEICFNSTATPKSDTRAKGSFKLLNLVVAIITEIMC